MDADCPWLVPPPHAVPNKSNENAASAYASNRALGIGWHPEGIWLIYLEVTPMIRRSGQRLEPEGAKKASTPRMHRNTLFLHNRTYGIEKFVTILILKFDGSVKLP